MHNLTQSQQAILSQLVFAEPWEHILRETGLSPGVIRDDLINLSHHNMIEVFESSGDRAGAPVRHFDNDHPEAFWYRATKSGLQTLSL